jgi:hypothetical protein
VRSAPLPRIAIALAASALAAGGCAATKSTSAGNFQGEPHLVAQTIDNLSSAGSSHDTNKICSQLLAQALVTTLSRSPGGCQRAIGNQLDDTDNFDLTVVTGTVKITGTSATAQVKDTQSGHTHYDTLKLVKESGSWKLSGLV